jgi:hypothetical protein
MKKNMPELFTVFWHVCAGLYTSGVEKEGVDGSIDPQ